MNFELTDEQEALAELAAQILKEGSSSDRLRELEQGPGPRFDKDLWGELANAGLLGIAIPEAYGGAAQSFFEIAMLLEQMGRYTAAVPLLETLVLGAMPLVEFGTEAQKNVLLPGVVEGRIVLTAGLVEAGGEALTPTTQARKTTEGYELSGTKLCVPSAQMADHIWIPAQSEDGAVEIFGIDPDMAGVRIRPLETTSGQPEARIELDRVIVPEAARLGKAGDGENILRWIRERATAALCASALGVCEESLRLTAEYTKSRKQFGSALATFQAVGQRQADAYIDTEAIRLTSWEAAWRLAEDRPAADAVAVAKYWAALGGQRVVHTAVHQHGGMGVDRDYPLHRYFLWAKQIELTLGGTSFQLRAIGQQLAAQ